MKCPKCNSDETYRKNPQELTVYCDRCNHHWQSQQSLVPLLQTKIYLSRGPMKGEHQVSVWYCPTNSTCYSFALTYGSGVCRFDEFEDDPYLSGSYPTKEAALSAGVSSLHKE